MRDTERQIVVEGCIQGNRLRIDRTNLVNKLIVDITEASEFVLEGPKETIRQVSSSHDNHEDEITGIVVIPATRPDNPEIGTKDIGKRTRITAGATSVSTDPISTPSTAQRPLRFKFLSLKHLSEKCAVPPKDVKRER